MDAQGGKVIAEFYAVTNRSENFPNGLFFIRGCLDEKIDAP